MCVYTIAMYKDVTTISCKISEKSWNWGFYYGTAGDKSKLVNHL